MEEAKEAKDEEFGFGSNAFGFTQRLADKVINGREGKQKAAVKKLAKDVADTARGKEIDST